MTTLPERPNAALLVIDMQIGVLAQAIRREAVVATIGELVARARDAGTPVLWVRHHDEDLSPDSDAWQIVEELAPDDGEPIVEKSYGDAFEETTLEDLLAERAVGHLIISGAQTYQCIRCTLHGGLTRGYDMTLVTDAHTTEDLTEYGAPAPESVIAHTNLYWTHQTAPGRIAGTCDAAAVEFRAPPGRGIG